jgi:hypothetical protein
MRKRAVFYRENEEPDQLERAKQTAHERGTEVRVPGSRQDADPQWLLMPYYDGSIAHIPEFVPDPDDPDAEDPAIKYVREHGTYKTRYIAPFHPSVTNFDYDRTLTRKRTFEERPDIDSLDYRALPPHSAGKIKGHDSPVATPSVQGPELPPAAEPTINLTTQPVQRRAGAPWDRPAPAREWTKNK